MAKQLKKKTALPRRRKKVKPSSLSDLTPEQQSALLDYAAWAGPSWKDKLTSDWMRAGTDWSGPYHLLHQIRNNFGPSWLSTLELPVTASKKKATTMKKKNKKVTAQDSNPGTVSSKLERRMGPDLASLFNTAGTKLYSNSVLTIKDGLKEIFQTAIDDLTEEIGDELGRRGKEEAAKHFGSFIKEIVQSVMKDGMNEVSDSLEDLASSAAAEFIQSTEEDASEGEEELFGVEDVEEVKEEPVAEPPAEEETAPAEGEEEVGFEELMGGGEEGEAEAGTKKGPRRWKSKKQLKLKKGEVAKEAELEIKDLVHVVGGVSKLRRGGLKTAQEAFRHLQKAQVALVKKLLGTYAVVQEVPSSDLEKWAKKYFPVAKKEAKRPFDKRQRKADNLGPEYFIPVTSTQLDPEVILWFHSGQSDPVYALGSRLVSQRPQDLGRTKASVKELEALESALENWLLRYQQGLEDETSNDEMVRIEKLLRNTKAILAQQGRYKPKPSSLWGKEQDAAFKAFFDAYVEGLLFGSTAYGDDEDDEGIPMDDVFGPNDIDQDCYAKMEENCAEFWIHFGPAIMEAGDPSDAGHDFAMTAQGTGAGFLDGRWPEALDRSMYEASDHFEMDLYGHSSGEGGVSC